MNENCGEIRHNTPHQSPPALSVHMIDWQDIDTVLLDMDGTLLDLHYDDFFWLNHLPQRYADFHGTDVSSAKATILDQIVELEGTLDWYCLDYWSEITRMDVPALKHEVKHKIQMRPHVQAFLMHLEKLGKKRVLITNSHRHGLDLKLQVTGIDKWLDLVISSHDYGSPKEQQAFWQRLQANEPFDPERTLFVDDTPRVLRSAQTYGIKHLVCITSPNSQKPEKSAEEFTGVSHLDELIC